MARHKAGLHKEISAIFEGVPVPKDSDAHQPPPGPVSDRNGYVLPKPLSPTPKPQQPTQSPPKAALPKQPKADAAVKTARRVPWQQTWQQVKDKLFTPKQGVSTARQKAMVILVPVLFIVLIFMFSQALSTPSPRTTKPPSFGPTNAVATSVYKIDWQVPAPYPTTLRDPMQVASVTTAAATATAQAEPGGLIIKGIVYSEDNPSAVIGTQIVHEGDMVLGATVTKINEDNVEFEMNDKRWTQKVQR